MFNTPTVHSEPARERELSAFVREKNERKGEKRKEGRREGIECRREESSSTRSTTVHLSFHVYRGHKTENERKEKIVLTPWTPSSTTGTHAHTLRVKTAPRGVRVSTSSVWSWILAHSHSGGGGSEAGVFEAELSR